MAGHVDHVVGAAQDKDVAVGVAHAPVEGGIAQPVRHRLPVGAHEAVVVAPDCAHASGRQRAVDGDHTLLVRRAFLAGVLVDDLQVVAVGRHARRPQLGRQRLDAALDRQDRPARLGLPVVVDHRLAQAVLDPARGGLVQRLAGQEQQPQAGQVVAREPGRVLLLQHADRGRRAEHQVDLVLLHQPPQDAAVRADRRAFIHQRGHAGQQRAIDDIAVPHHPADVRRGEHGVAGFAAEDVFHRSGQRHRVAAGIALHALGLAGGAGGVEHVRRLARFQPHTRHVHAGHALAPGGIVLIAALGTGHLRQLPVHQQHLLGLVRREPDGLVQQRLVGHHFAGARAGVGADHHARPGILDARGQADRGKAAEHHRMDRADARARQHGKCGFRNHRHVDQHTVALLYAQALQGRSHAADLVVQLSVGIGAGLVGLGRDPVQRWLAGAGRQVAVDRVVAQVGEPADEPARKGRAAVVEHLAERGFPVDARRLFGPEPLGVGQRTGMHGMACRHVCLLRVCGHCDDDRSLPPARVRVDTDSERGVRAPGPGT
ncbi:hypothetical protein D9M72_345060 [compost metagenome]